MPFGQNPVTGSQGALPANQFPVPSVAPPGNANGDLIALEGGPISTDSNTNKTAPASIYVKDGNDLTQGLTTDAAVVGDNPGSISAKLRGLLKIWTDIWDSVNHRIKVDGSAVTQPVSGTFWQATQPISGTITANQGGSNWSINHAQVAGTSVSVNAGTTDAGTQRVAQGGAATGTKTTVVSSASSVTILAANTARKGALAYNDSTSVLYLDLSGGTASSSSYSVQVLAQGFFELPGPTIYNGAITGIWSVANGNARVTELS